MVGGSPAVVPENIYTHPRKVNKNSRREGGYKSMIFVKESMTLDWNFWSGGGKFKLKSLPWWGMDTLWNNTLYTTWWRS